MPNPVRVAVTGLGVSRGMLKFYRDSPDTKLVLLHDVDEARAQEVAAECPGTRYTLKYEDVLKSDAEMVDVSTPNQCHAEQAIAALEAGKHVLCQKPMAPAVRDCRAMCEAARRTGKTLGMHMTMLTIPLCHTLKALVQQGLLGKIAAVRIRNAHRGPLRKADKNHWRAKAANIGGGSYMQLGVHSLNLVQWLLDDEIVRVSGFAKNLYCQHSLEGEDVVAASGEFKGGPLIAMESGYSSVGNSTGIYGTEGHLVMNGDGGGLDLEARAPWKDGILEYPKAGRKVGELSTYEAGSLTSRRTITAADPHVQQLAFARAVRDGRPAPTAAEIGLRDVAIIQAIYRAAETGRRVEVRELVEEAGK